MIMYEPTPGMYRFQYLPAFARFLLDAHLEDYVADQLKFSRQLELPLLKHLTHLSDEQIIGLAREASSEYLEFLARDQAFELVTTSMQRWLKDELNIVGKFDVNAEDITALNYVRGRVLRKWIAGYKATTDDKFALIEEIELFLFGATTTAVNTFLDIVRKKIAEESHFTNELINTSPGIIFIFDISKNREVYVNGNVKQVMGYTAEEVMAMGTNLLANLTHPDDLSTLAKHFQEILSDRSGKTHQVEYRFRHKDGAYRWLRTYDVIFKQNQGGNVVELLGTTFEITKEKATAAALAKRERQLLEAQAIAQIGSFEWDMVGDNTLYTPALASIFEWGAESKRKSWLTNVHPEDVPKVESALAMAKESGKYDHQYRYLIGGKQKFLWTRGVVIFENGKPVLMRGTVQDITQLKQIEHELLRKTIELERSNESLQQFASIASHDLKEPLRKMSMYTDMVMTIEEEKLTPGSSQNLEKVKSSAIRMQNMIDDILKFSSMTREEKKEKVSLKSIVMEAIAILEEIIREKNVQIRTGELPEIRVIPSQIRQLFQNLISNAIKFSKPDVTPEITISHQYISRTEADGDPALELAPAYVKILVSDNGIGFRQEYAEKIFGLFTRLHGRSVYEGSGLGLTICKRIAENHGGTIHAESKPGQGSTFTVILPAHG
jgi:PAS domain S-box-containing protein